MADLSKTHPLNAKQVRTAFGISPVTLFLWRKGTEKRAPLPCKQVWQGAAARVGFKQAELEKWAKKHGVEIKVPFAEVIQQQELHQAKPGPKAATAPTEQKKSSVARASKAQAPVKTKDAAAKPAKAPSKPLVAKKVTKPSKPTKVAAEAVAA